MTLTFDLEVLNHILFPMFDFVGAHMKTKAKLSCYITAKISTDTKFYKITQV